jgi:very-long-chain ceramide synthase
VFLVVSEMYLISGQSFLYQTHKLWKKWPLILSTHRAVKVFYLAELSFYIEELFALYIEPKMKDYLEIIHHIVTMVLIFGFWRMSLCIIFLHGISDLLLELAKLMLYCKKQTMANAMFVIFAIVFIASRCICFPAWILRSS